MFAWGDLTYMLIAWANRKVLSIFVADMKLT